MNHHLVQQDRQRCRFIGRLWLSFILFVFDQNVFLNNNFKSFQPHLMCTAVLLRRRWRNKRQSLTVSLRFTNANINCKAQKITISSSFFEYQQTYVNLKALSLQGGSDVINSQTTPLLSLLCRAPYLLV